MKHIKILSAILIVTMVTSSCLLTFYPIYTPEDVVFDPSLLGSYDNKEAKDGQPDRMHIVRLGNAVSSLPPEISKIRDKGYLVRFGETDGRITSEYIAFMVILNKKNYIDFFPYTKNARQFGSYAGLKIPMHAVYRIVLQGGKNLSLQRFDQEFLQEMIKNKQIRLRHEKIDDKYVITASTKELQQYITKYGDVPGAYEKDAETYIKK